MSIRLSRPATVVLVVLAAVLFALPACRKKDDSPEIGLALDPGDQRLFSMSQNNLKQIALAMHNYHDVMGRLPTNFVTGPDGKTVPLSWRVQLLPYIDEGPLYEQFMRNLQMGAGAWDSPQNKALISQMPRVYAAPGGKGDPEMTYYRSFVGKNAIMPPEVKGWNSGRRLTDIVDGTSNTLMVAEAAEPVIWTKPDDLVFDPSGPLPKLGGVFRGGANVALCDGSVQFLRWDAPPETLKALITINGEERLGGP